MSFHVGNVLTWIEGWSRPCLRIPSHISFIAKACPKTCGIGPVVFREPMLLIYEKPVVLS
ncbi:hypothetical protein LJ738_00840 [Hymenobacter sp. BT770]|nr:hypothetical protein [Hymenobacter sp. BT770]